MLPAGITIRRATLDDIETLRGLWREFRLPEHELEKRFTEFQLAVDAQGWIVGALALRFAGHQGQVHSLAIRRADLEPVLLPAFWERLVAIAHRQGTYRLWSREHGAWWNLTGFGPATAADRSQLPPSFGESDRWLTLKLRDEPLKLIAAEEQLAAYVEMERLKTERLVRRGRFLKIIVTALAAALFATALAVLLVLVRRSRPTPARRPLP